MNKINNDTYLWNIFNSIIPNSLTTQQFFMDSLDIMTKLIEYYNPYPQLSLFINETQRIMSRELLLLSSVNDLYRTSINSLNSPAVISKSQELGLPLVTTKQDIENLLNTDFLYISKFIKVTKGLAGNIQLNYNTIENMGIQNTTIGEFGLEMTGKPFEFKVTGSMTGELYQQTVKRTSHPLGFMFSYSLIIILPPINELVYDIKDEFEMTAMSYIRWVEVLEFDKFIIELWNPSTTDVRKKNDFEFLDFNYEEDFLISTSENTDDAGIEGYIRPHIKLKVDIDERLSQKHIKTDTLEF